MPRAFSARLLGWYDRHGRHDLPWQHPRSAYRVWLAEVMLQQTQVATAILYYRRFLKRFPSLTALARAPQDDVLALWSGLGYYARARNLHRTAQIVGLKHGGRFPQDFESVLALPGIGRSTAGAILAQAFGQRHAILDGNVRRVLARWAAIPGATSAPATQKKLWALSESLLSKTRLADYTQALMDLGATLCTTRNPQCARCPLASDCKALRLKRVANFPAAKPRKRRPQRRTHLLLIENRRGQWLLEKRPATGIWGGLWCPPLAKQIATARVQRRRPVIHHGFSHYDLDLIPVHVDESLGDAAAVRRWATLKQTLALGLPAPIRTLFTEMNSI